jgi:cardiolipin synthase (CMP-forming)
MTIPNCLTLLRILLTPVLIWLLLNSHPSPARLNQALFVFLLAGFTDGLDGLLARVLHQKSKLGAYLDPLADKLLLVSCFILLGRSRLLPNWLVVIVVSRDAIILLGIVTLMLHQVRVQIRPSVVSKITTLMQLMTVFIMLCSTHLVLPNWAYWVLFKATAVATAASGLHYMLIGVQLWEAQRSADNGGTSPP